MEITRTSLRAQRNQKAPKHVSQRQTQEKGGYGEELKEQLQTIGNIRRREAPVITSKKEPPRDHKDWENVEDKYNNHFSENPG